MDTDTAGVILKLFSSLGFILLGAAVSRIAAFISGIDIFRDLSAEHARLIALTAGIIIFILSPLGYLIMYPEYFACWQSGGSSPQPLIAPELWGKLWSFRSLAPFVGLFFGFGIVYGSLQILDPREELIRRLGRLGLRLVLQTYGSVWDDFFRNRKPHCPVAVRLSDATIVGEVVTFAIRDESREIRLRNYCVAERTDRPGEPPNPFDEARHGPRVAGDILIGERSIEEISIPTSFMRQGRKAADHVTHGLYMALAGLGCLILCLSADQTLAFLAASQVSAPCQVAWGGIKSLLDGMSGFYRVASVVLLLLSSLFLLCALVAPAWDIVGRASLPCRLVAAMAMTPAYLRLMAFLFALGLASMAYFRVPENAWPEISYLVRVAGWVAASCYALGSLAVLFLFVSCRHGRALRRLFDRLCRDIASEPGREARFRTLERLLDELYYYLDLNRESGRGGYERLTEQLLRRGDYGEVAPALFSCLDKTRHGPMLHLAGVEYNVIGLFRRWLATHGEAPAAPARGAAHLPPA